jgi:hypothetical protein
VKLTRDQRNALFAGQKPKLTFPGEEDCPVEVGHVETLSSNVSFEVTAIDKTKDGEHSLRYTVHDKRSHHRFLARQQGQMPNPNLNYVNNPSRGIDLDAGEAVDEFTQQRITKESHSRQAHATADLIAAAEEFITTLNERFPNGQARLMKHRIRKELERFIERQRRKAA